MIFGTPRTGMETFFSLNVLFLWVKLVKYLTWVPQLQVIGRTFSKAATHLMSFGLLFLVFLMGFVLAFYIQFGGSLLQ